MEKRAPKQRLPAHLERARPQIKAWLSKARPLVFTEGELQSIFAERRNGWGIPKETNVAQFLRFLVEKEGMRLVELTSETYSPMARYVVGEVSPYEIALSLKPRAYLCHGTAVFLHGLNDQLPKTIYVNQEQSPKPRGSELTQARLDLAFSRHQRVSNYSYRLDSFRVVLLSGKNTGRMGVKPIRGPKGEKLEATSIERTLVDIVVRPAYAGGIVQVLEAYRGAKGRVSAASLVRVLRKLDYVYPYHQAIGFLMERAGYPSEDCAKLLSLGTRFDFYLAHGLKAPERDAKWHLFYPKGL